jgi:hypothetical protein
LKAFERIVLIVGQDGYSFGRAFSPELCIWYAAVLPRFDIGTSARLMAFVNGFDLRPLLVGQFDLRIALPLIQVLTTVAYRVRRVAIDASPSYSDSDYGLPCV